MIEPQRSIGDTATTDCSTGGGSGRRVIRGPRYRSSAWWRVGLGVSALLVALVGTTAEAGAAPQGPPGLQPPPVSTTCLPTQLLPLSGAAVAEAPGSLAPGLPAGPNGPGNGPGPNGQDLVAFGGNGVTGAVADTWVFDGSAWTLLHPGVSPPARSAAGFAYDPALHEDVLFGGLSASGAPLDGTWAWNGADWAQLHPATSPPARSAAAFAYGPIPHGQPATPTPPVAPATPAPSVPPVPPISATGPTPPPAPGDEGHGLVLFGGQGTSGLLDDTWAFDGADWVQLHPATSPPARSAAAFAYGPIPHGQPVTPTRPVAPATPAPSVPPGNEGHGDVLFGGLSASGTPLDGTWAFDGADWVQLHPATSPPARSAAAFAYGPIPHGSPATPTPPVAPATPAPSVPPGNEGHGLVLFGGQDTSGLLDDTWAFDGAGWRELSPATSPPALSGAASAYDPRTRQVFLVGGDGYASATAAATTPTGDTYGFDGQDWSLLAKGASAPSAPGAVHAEAGHYSATITWQAPGELNGAPVISYRVVASPGGVQAQVSGCPAGLRATVTVLDPGTTYTFRVVATSAAGTSPVSAPSSAVTLPAGPPLPPSRVNASAGNADAVVAWSAPPDGGSPITAYHLAVSPSCNTCAGLSLTGSPPATSTSVSGLTNATGYTFSLSATNAIGTSPLSGASLEVTPTATTSLPGEPVGIHATPGVQSLSVSFDPPPSDGGSPVSSYEVSATPVGTAQPALAQSAISKPALALARPRGATSPVADPPPCLIHWLGHCVFYPPGGTDPTDPVGTWGLQFAGGPPGSVALDMSCADQTDCVAVGVVLASTSGTSGTSGNVVSPLVLVSHDAGAAWTQSSLPVAVTELSGVSCASASDCVAVGSNFFFNTSSSQNTSDVAIFTTDGGTTWQVGTLPTGVSALTGVSCPTASDCYAMGYSEASSSTSGPSSEVLVTTDGGLSWVVSQSFPALSFSPFPIGGISCASASTCVGVGITISTSTTTTSAGTTFTGLVAPSAIATSDGGASWTTSQMSAPMPDTGPVSVPVRVSCATTTSCVAVGADNGFFGAGSSGGPLAWATTDGGATWAQSVPDTGVASGVPVELWGVSCPSATVCYATGFTMAAVATSSGGSEVVPSGPVIDGTADAGATWDAQSATVPSGEVLAVTSVSCTAVDRCEASGALGSASTYTTDTTAAAVLELGASSCPAAPTFPYLSASPAGAAQATAVSTTISGNPPATAATLSGLMPGVPYLVSVSAVSANGQSCPAYLSPPVLPAGPFVPAVPSSTGASGASSGAHPLATRSDPAAASGWPSIAPGADVPDPDGVLSGGALSVFATRPSGCTSELLPGQVPGFCGIPDYQFVRGANGGWSVDLHCIFFTFFCTNDHTALPDSSGSVPGWVYEPAGLFAPGVFDYAGYWWIFFDAQYTNGNPQPPLHSWDYCIGVARGPAGGTALNAYSYFADHVSTPFACADGSLPNEILPRVDLGGVIDASPFVDPETGKAYLIVKTGNKQGGPAAAIWSVPIRFDPANGSLEPAGAAIELGGDGLALHQPPNWQPGAPGTATVEAPDMVYVAGTYYLMLSGNSYLSSAYSEGYAICPQGPVAACDQAGSSPVLSTYPGAYGPGSGDVFFDSHNHPWMVYDAWNSPCANYSCGVPDTTPGVSCPTPFFGYCPAVRQLYIAPLDFAPVVGMASHGLAGYWQVASDGEVFNFGSAPRQGSLTDQCAYFDIGCQDQSIVGMAATPDSGGYWVSDLFGNVYTFGDAGWGLCSSPQASVIPGFGTICQPFGITGIASGPTDSSFYLTTIQGSVYPYGTSFLGDASGLASSVVGIASTPDGGGYWLAASDGSVYSYGDAGYYGSAGGISPSAPIVGIAHDPAFGGYWLVTFDGQVFTFSAFGASAGAPLASGVVGIASAPPAPFFDLLRLPGYWLFGADGTVLPAGDAQYEGVF